MLSSKYRLGFDTQGRERMYIRKIPCARKFGGERLGCLRVVLIYFVLANRGLGGLCWKATYALPRYVILPDGSGAYIDLRF